MATFQIGTEARSCARPPQAASLFAFYLPERFWGRKSNVLTRPLHTPRLNLSVLGGSRSWTSG